MLRYGTRFHIPFVPFAQRKGMVIYMKVKKIMLIPLHFPIVKEGDNIGCLIGECLHKQGITVHNGDIFVVAQKIVSIAENRIVKLDTISSNKMAYELSEQTGRTPELCQTIIDESSQILGVSGRNVITRHKLGFVCTNAGIDSSNVAQKSERIVSLLPEDPDASASMIRNSLIDKFGKKVSVVISDSFGREFRHGSIGEAIGISGIDSVVEIHGKDIFGNETTPKIAIVDEVASAATILMGEQDEKIPVVIVRGVKYCYTETGTIKNMLK